MKEEPNDMTNEKKNDEDEEESSSSDDDSESSNASSSDSSDTSDEDGSDSENRKKEKEDGGKANNEVTITKEDEDDFDNNETARLSPKQEYLKLKEKRTNLFKRALKLRDEMKDADIEAKKRLLKEIKNMRERCLTVQTRITNIKARLSHSPTPERQITTTVTAASENSTLKEPSNQEKRTNQPSISQRQPETHRHKSSHHHTRPTRRSQHRQRLKTSSSRSRSRSQSTSPPQENKKSEKANTSFSQKLYRDLDEPSDSIKLNDFDQFGTGGIPTSALTSRGLKAALKSSQQRSTSYLDLTDNSTLNNRSPTRSPSNLNRLSLKDRDIIDSSMPYERDPSTLIKQTSFATQEALNEHTTPSTPFANIKFPYPVINDNRDLDTINRILKDKLRQSEQKCNHLLFEQTNATNNNDYDNMQQQIKRLHKQIEYINGRIKIEKLKRTKCKTQREKEQAKKKMQSLIKDVHKLHSFMKIENRNYLNENATTNHNNSFESTQYHEKEINNVDETNESAEEQLSPKDLLKVTGRKTMFHTDSESEMDDEDKQKQKHRRNEVIRQQQPQVPVCSSQSDIRTVPNAQISDPDFKKLPPSSHYHFDFSVPPPPMGTLMPSTLNTIKSRVTNLLNVGPTTNKSQLESKKMETDGATTTATRTNRKRRKKKKNNKKTNNNDFTTEIKENLLDRNDDLKFQVAMQLEQSFLNNSLMETNPILKALTFEAQKKLGINVNSNNKTNVTEDLSIEPESMDYENENENGSVVNPSPPATGPPMFPFNMINFLSADNTNLNPLMNRYLLNNSSSSTHPNLADFLSTFHGNSNLLSQQHHPKTFENNQQQTTTPITPTSKSFSSIFEQFTTQSSTIPKTPVISTPEDNLIQARKILNSLTHNDINELLKLSGDEHDDDYDSDDNNLSIDGGDMSNFTRGGLFDEDNSLIDIDNWNENKLKQEQQEPQSQDGTIKHNGQQQQQHNKIQTSKNTKVTLILPSLNRFTYLGKPTRRVERTFSSFSTQKQQTENNVSFVSLAVPTSYFNNNDLKTGLVLKVSRSIGLPSYCMASLFVDKQRNHHTASMPSYTDYKTSYSSYEQKSPMDSSSDNIRKSSRSNSSCSSLSSTSSRSSSTSSTSSHSSFSSSSSNSIISFDQSYSKYDGKRKRLPLDTPNKRISLSTDSFGQSSTKPHASRSETSVKKPLHQSQQQQHQIKLPYPVLADHRDSQSVLVVLQKETQTTNKKIHDVTQQIEDKEKRLMTSNSNNKKLLKHERTKLKQQLDTLKKHERRVNLQIDYITTKMEIKGLEDETNKKKSNDTTTDDVLDSTNGTSSADSGEENQQQIKMLCSKLRQKLDKMKVYMKARNDQMKKTLTSIKQSKSNSRNKLRTSDSNNHINSKQSSSSSNRRETKGKCVENNNNNNNKEKNRSSTMNIHRQLSSSATTNSSSHNKHIRSNNLHRSSSTNFYSSTTRRSHQNNNQKIRSISPKFKLTSRVSANESTSIKFHSSPSTVIPTVRFVQKTDGDPVKSLTTNTITPPPPSDNSVIIQQPTPACSSFSSLSPVSSSSNGGYGTSSITMNNNKKDRLSLPEQTQETENSFGEDDEDIDVSDIFDQTDDETNDDDLEVGEFNEGDILKLQAEMDDLERRLKLKREKETTTTMNDIKK
ncbi:unnamed protein product [Didymodactylos carnosus]|uniref:Uncharacterized protein n=1 Tax=Didymodactylos carnosus TaxID=1234261 RepID=A0A814BRC2_9BILA|nr:unnamed protein product [Didymodactylos carnosus]CAF3708203.1 unnamed protein product [Didymodactylos carnosus]